MSERTKAELIEVAVSMLREHTNLSTTSIKAIGEAVEGDDSLIAVHCERCGSSERPRPAHVGGGVIEYLCVKCALRELGKQATGEES